MIDLEEVVKGGCRRPEVAQRGYVNLTHNLVGQWSWNNRFVYCFVDITILQICPRWVLSQFFPSLRRKGTRHYLR